MMRILYIDGENFFHQVLRVLREEGLIKQRRDIKDLDVQYLIQAVLGGQEVDEVRYYAANLELLKGKFAAKTKKMIIEKRQWQGILGRNGVKLINSGALKLRDGRTCQKCGHKAQIFQEKGVDVRLAVDIVRDVLKGHATKVCLLSSDTDLIPALALARSQKVQTVYCGFSEAVNGAMIASAHETLTYQRRDVIEAYKRSQK